MAMTIVDGPQQDLTELCEIQEKAIVSMRQLGQEERSAYLESGDWHDKAGGYGIQTAARTFVELVSGEIDTVIGLPSAVLLRYWEAYSAGRSLAHVEH